MLLEVFKVITLSTIAITLWTAFILLQDKRSLPALTRWFAAFLFALTTQQIDTYATSLFPSGIYLLSLVAFTFLFLKGPFIWIFLSILLRNNIKPPKVLIHFLPWLASLLTLLFFPQYWPTIYLLGMCHMLLYLLTALLVMVHKRLYIANLYKGFKNTSYYWLLYVVGGLTLLMTMELIAISLIELGVLKNYNLLNYIAVPAFSIYALCIGVLSIYRPEFFFRETISTDYEQTSDKSGTDTKNLTPQQPIASLSTQDPNNQKSRYLELDRTLAQALTQELEKLMKDKQLYRQNELSLPDLAQSLGVSVHQLSELLNVHLGVSFYEFINNHRLQFACNLLQDPECQLRILDIAFEAGFNNKNSFYRTFKDTLGVTPNQYREQTNHLELKPV